MGKKWCKIAVRCILHCIIVFCYLFKIFLSCRSIPILQRKCNSNCCLEGEEMTCPFVMSSWISYCLRTIFKDFDAQNIITSNHREIHWLAGHYRISKFSIFHPTFGVGPKCPIYLNHFPILTCVLITLKLYPKSQTWTIMFSSCLKKNSPAPAAQKGNPLSICASRELLVSEGHGWHRRRCT